MADPNAVQSYRQQIGIHQAKLAVLLRKRNLFGWLRLVVFVGTILISYKIFADYGLPALLPLLTGISVFIYLILIDADNNDEIRNRKTLIHINEEEIRIAGNEYTHRPGGENFSPAVHGYAGDLDLFGPSSLFQWMNRCATEQGQERLVHDLLHPLPLQRIRQRQEAIKELAGLTAWRQQLQSYAEQTTLTRSTQDKTGQWLREEDRHFVHPAWKIFVWLYTAVTVLTVGATILGFIPSVLFLFLYASYYTASVFLSRNTIKPYLQLTGIVPEMSTLEKLIGWIEEQEFHSGSLKQLQTEIGPEHKKASVRIKELKSILDRFDLRLNMVGPLVLNTFLLWDVRQMLQLNEWRKKNRELVPRLFEVIAEAEVLNTLTGIHFNHPEWCLPEVVDRPFVFESLALGHPLIPDGERVTNDFRIGDHTLISLVTGSNMAGKSTFLRCIGVNIVLAQMGGPVCAKRFTASTVRLMTSMRIADNLAESTSTFYAELKKLKTIIEAVNRHEPIFVLLDEILRGTNSNDRHTGSSAFIRQLIRQHAFALIATHDLELAQLAEQYPEAIENYHFDVQVRGEELFFDYRLKEGVCHSLNASLLMKKIGIELPD